MPGTDGLTRGGALASMVPVWALALVGAILVGALTGALYLTWLPVVMALCILVAFAIQLALGMRPGLVARLGGSLSGAVVVLGIATAVLIVAVPRGLHIPF